MKIHSVRPNNNRHAFEVSTRRHALVFPYAKAEPRPTADDPVISVVADAEIGREGFTYVLASGKEGTIHIDDVLYYNRDPKYMRDHLLYRLTAVAQDRAQNCGLSRREIIRRLGTSPAQFYRLLDTTNYRKSIDKMVELLYVLDCEVEFVIGAREERAIPHAPVAR